jgi:hypothetical protein
LYTYTELPSSFTEHSHQDGRNICAKLRLLRGQVWFAGACNPPEVRVYQQKLKDFGFGKCDKDNHSISDNKIAIDSEISIDDNMILGAL